MSGHWFCHKCDEIVFSRHMDNSMVCCPVCSSDEIQFIRHDAPKKLSTPVVDDATAHKLFDQMREVISKPTAADIIGQNIFKTIL
jgi:hypothetical protein